MGGGEDKGERNQRSTNLWPFIQSLILALGVGRRGRKELEILRYTEASSVIVIDKNNPKIILCVTSLLAKIRLILSLKVPKSNWISLCLFWISFV